ncbi:MAG: selenocysteine-specific translation elongation factor [Synergistaceae bacterium]|nr:selenocysteine-specific translation elongation factor [Synergistaceae bacterium]
MKHIIIGTAGHIDHGKTALIRALTGRNTDRLKEEQERGITIDLGFTWFDLKDGSRAGIIDVPGHEKFINNMVAGVVGMDLVLMVVAADEGIMPQTVEHLDILSLLGVQKCILVLNKCDLVEAEWLNLMEQEIRERLSDTFMRDAPLVRVSALTGEGLEELKDKIAELVRDDVQERDAASIPRLPIDRVFSVRGFGTVVTGTLLSGTLAQEEELEIYPLGQRCSVRGIEVHGEKRESCAAGQRVAVNLSNVKKEALRRGCVLALPNSMKNTQRIDASLTILKDSRRTLPNRARLHLFTGTSEVLCRAALLEKEELKPGETSLAQLILEDAIAAKKGDRFVVRFYSPLETIGGGVILEPNASRKKRFDEEALSELRRKESGSLADICELHIKNHGDTMLSLSELVKITSNSREELLPCLDELERQGSVYVFSTNKDRFYWDRDHEMAVRQKILKDLEDYHEQHPYRDGLPAAHFHRMYLGKVKPQIFQKYIEAAAGLGTYQVNGEYLCRPGFEVKRDERYLRIERRILDALDHAGFDFLRLSEIPVPEFSQDTALDVVQRLIDEGAVVKLNAELYTLQKYIDEAKERILLHFKNHPSLSIGQVRDIFQNSRKSAKPLLQYMDTIRVTRKVTVETERVAFQV